MQKAIDFYKLGFSDHKKSIVCSSFEIYFRAQDVAKMLTKCS